MERSKAEEVMLEKLAEGINSTSKLTHALLEEIKGSEADFAVIKTELSILRENVKSLSEIVREGNGATSLITKISLIDQKIQDLYKWIDNHEDSHYRIKNEISDLKKQLNDLVHDNSKITDNINDIKQRMDESEEFDRKSMHQAIEWNQIRQKSDLSVREEKDKAKIKVISGIIITVITATLGLVGWYLKEYSEKNTYQQQDNIQYHNPSPNPDSSSVHLPHDSPK